MTIYQILPVLSNSLPKWEAARQEAQELRQSEVRWEPRQFLSQENPLFEEHKLLGPTVETNPNYIINICIYSCIIYVFYIGSIFKIQLTYMYTIRL